MKTWHGIEGNLYGHNNYDEFVRNYHATILSVDDSVGRLYEALRQMAELDNTVIVFAGDNLNPAHFELGNLILRLD
jgi:arylsulfatase A-like enzyme